MVHMAKYVMWQHDGFTIWASELNEHIILLYCTICLQLLSRVKLLHDDSSVHHHALEHI